MLHQILLGWSSQGGWDGWADENAHKILVGKAEGKRPHGRL